MIGSFEETVNKLSRVSAALIVLEQVLEVVKTDRRKQEHNDGDRLSGHLF